MRRRRPSEGRAPRILLIRPDHLGDVLLASPAERVLREVLPESQIDWLVGPWSAEMVRRAGDSGKVMTFDFPGFTRRPSRSVVEPYVLLASEAAKLRAQAYDAALVLRPDHWWGAMLASLAGIPRRFGYSVAECTPFLTDTLPPPSGPHRHAVRVNQALARLAAIRLAGRPPSRCLHDPQFRVSTDDLAWAATWIAANVDGPTAQRATSDAPWLPANEPLVALHPGSGAILKNWLPERWAELLTDLRERHRARVFLTGGPGDAAVVASIASRLNPSPPTVIGQTSLGQLAALFASSDLVLGCDSGPLHLAAAVGAPTVRLYGPTDTNEFGPWSPRGKTRQHRAVSGLVPCQPCRALVAPPCGATERPACMQMISVGAVLDATEPLLSPGGPDRRKWEEPAALRPADLC
jgi:heptosyltransferase-2/heptosyltransferase-3